MNEVVAAPAHPADLGLGLERVLLGGVANRPLTSGLSESAGRLKNQLEAAKVQPGDGQGVQYEGTRTPKNGGRDHNAYRVAVQAVGERNPDAAFKVPAASGPDLGLVAGAEQASVWSSEGAPF